MKPLKYIFLFLIVCGFSFTSCDDFFDTKPYDQLSPATFWKTENDVQSAATACYDKWSNPQTGSTDILFADCMSDIAYNSSNASAFRTTGNGSMSATSTVNYYNYETIRRCNTFLANAEDVKFKDEAVKKDLFAQVRTIRAWRYFHMNFWYGGVPLITNLPQTSEEAQLPRDSEDAVKQFVYKELDAAIPDLNEKPSQRGRIARGTALAIKMRAALYWGDLDLAMNAARSIKNLNLYELDPDYQGMFSIKGQSSKEIIYAMQHVSNTYAFTNVIRMYNNQDGGWASMAPTQNIVNMYEMKSGLLPEEPGSGYDPIHPFANRDPRLALTILYPGMDWVGSNGKLRVINTLDKTINGDSNADYMDASNNSSKTGMIWAKYTVPLSQYSASLSNDNICPILFRYAEILLTIAEINVEKNENFTEVYDILDQLRTRCGHVVINRAKYNTQEKLRELLRRERCIELAGEGLRKADLLRWKDQNGKMLAETLMNGTLYRMTGTVNTNEPDRDLRATITAPTSENESLRKIEDRVFRSYNRYLPIPQAELDKNPNLKQNDGYN
ncbi:membrane protein [Bacteroidia bacterium]|nr:membrane protein [Bacteroidia bacterium]GHV22344.1 membrane protein [Bacteroidia bacterium]